VPRQISSPVFAFVMFTTIVPIGTSVCVACPMPPPMRRKPPVDVAFHCFSDERTT
jgi:hypothetical protein